MRHVSELLVPGFGLPVLLCRGRMPQALVMAAYVRDGYGTFRQRKFECGCCEMVIFKVCGGDGTYMCSVFTATLTLVTGFFTVY